MGQDGESAGGRDILAAHHLSEEEYDLLAMLRMERAPPNEFVVYIRNLAKLGREPQLEWSEAAKVPEYVAALDRLMGRGLVFVLTASDIENERRRWAASDLPGLSRGVESSRPGFVEHTPAGAALLRQVFTEMGGDHLALHDTGGDHDYRNHRWDFYSSRADLCARFLASTADCNEVVEQHGPVEIGPWRPDQFVVLPRGFHGYLRYVPRERPPSPK
jgi:hypothetical protein